jgi:hypothetical protein
VRAFLCTLFSVFGEPQELAPRTLTLKQHQLIAPWVRAGEALLRVYNDPMPYARRLARRLRKQVALAVRITSSAWQEFRDIIGRTLFDLLGPPLACAARIAARANSS